jgi:hypothetical protein
MGQLTRRQFVSGIGGLTVGAMALSAVPAWATAATSGHGLPTGAGPARDDTVAAAYYRLLLLHTHWAEQQWDATAGHYSGTDFSFAVVLGNAVLLTHGDYDASVAGVDAATLRAHTVATISHFAASNVLTGGTEWGETMFFDSTFELYFVLAAKLLWSELDDATRATVDRMAAAQADYTTAIGSGDDPRSPGWSPNGLLGGWVGDTKVDEMAVYTQCYGPALAWLPDNANAATWQTWFDRWALNSTGLPPADLANPALVDGHPIAEWNTAHNVFDTFFVENHGSFEPHYQLETFRMSARVTAHFLAAGRAVPAAVTAKPNGTKLWETIRRVQSDSGEPFMPMDADRYHLFGRDVLPLAFIAQILGDRDAARSEANMAAQLGPYLLYPPTYQLTKFSGEAKYEPEARAELAISYLFHVWRDQHGGPVIPVSDAQFFTAASAATDYGVTPGLLAQNTRHAFAATVTKPGFVKFVYAPNHDDWLFDVSASTPSLLPTTGSTVLARSAVAYNALRDGFDATASLLRLSTGHAGYATLPSGAVAYATSGNGAGEGSLRVFNLTMPGISGLTGQRTFTGASGAVTVSESEAGTGGTDDLSFATVSARYVRMLGVRPGTQYGYSIYELDVHGSDAATNLALGKPTTASSFTPAYPPAAATDGNTTTTRWAVAVADRAVADSWLQVDLGAATDVDRVTLVWEAAYGAAYLVQTSLDGTNWTTAATVPTGHSFGGNWLNVDGLAGFVVRGSTNPITVGPNAVVLSDGPAAGASGMVVEGYPAQSPAATRTAAGGPVPTGGPATLASAVVDGYLCLFNLADTAIPTTALTIPRRGADLDLYQGTQTTTAAGTVHDVALDAATARVEAPLHTLGGRSLPSGLVVTVVDSRQVRIAVPHGGRGGVVTVTALAGRGERRTVVLVPGRTSDVRFDTVALAPSPDIALGRTTFPTSPLPSGMSDPAFAVDGNPATAWRPGPGGGRMVVDLGASSQVGTVALTWAPGRTRTATVSVSDDGLTYRGVGTVSRGGTVAAATTARYVAVTVPTWTPGDAGLTTLSVLA